MKMADSSPHHHHHQNTRSKAEDVTQAPNGSMQRHTTNGLPQEHIMPNSYQPTPYPGGVMKPVPVMPPHEHPASQNYSVNSSTPNYAPPHVGSFAPVQSPMPNYSMSATPSPQQLGPPRLPPPTNVPPANLQRPGMPDVNHGQGPMQNGPVPPPRMPMPHPGYGGPPSHGGPPPRMPHLAGVRPLPPSAVGTSPTPSDSKTNSSMGPATSSSMIPPQPNSSALRPAVNSNAPVMYGAGSTGAARSPFTMTAPGSLASQVVPSASPAYVPPSFPNTSQQNTPSSFQNYVSPSPTNAPVPGMQSTNMPNAIGGLAPQSNIRPTISNTRRQYPQQPAYQQRPPQPVPTNAYCPPDRPSVASQNPQNLTNSGYTQPTVNTSTNTHPAGQNVGSYGPNQLAQQMGYFNFQGTDSIDLMQHRNILPPVHVEAPQIVIPQHDYKDINCSPDVFRCTLTKIPGTQSLLQKSRLPLGILIHPFKDLTHLPVIQCTTIVRCRSCRTYINPFVYFVDNRRWKCNLCFRVNELPEEFMFDPVSKSYGDPARRPEVKSATIEFIAPSEYMLRPPQPAVYLFVMDVSFAAVESNYLKVFCDALLEELDNLPGDSRTQVGFITFDSSLHYYNLAEGLSQPQMMIVSDVEDAFLPCPDNLLVNLHECKENVQDLLRQLPITFLDNRNPDSALGAALQAAMKLMSPTGGRVTVLQSSIPNYGPGHLKPREDPNQRASKDVQNIGPANDFYKKLSLDCSSHQIAVDLFVIASQYVDIATIGCISKYSGGCIRYYPGFHSQNDAAEMERFEKDLRRYFTRKVGFEAVMRIRCSKGLAIHTFHGNFFVRSTDLLSLPNINPDTGFGMQITIEEQLTEANSACFQAALLYTSSKGERRIRVHTMCLSVTGLLSEVMSGADQQAIVGLLAKMAVDRTLISSLSDAREAMMNACIDPLNTYKTIMSGSSESLMSPMSLNLLPLYILALLKHAAFRVGTCTKLDERVFAMNQMKTLPLYMLMLSVYPDLYPVHSLDEKNAIQVEDKLIPQPPLLQLSSEKIDSHGAYLLDTGDHFYLYICRAINDQFCQNVLRASNFATVDDRLRELPELDTPHSELLRNFVSHLQALRPFSASFHIIREDSKLRHLFLQHLIEDRSESAFSYYELLQHVKRQIHK